MNQENPSLTAYALPHGHLWSIEPRMAQQVLKMLDATPLEAHLAHAASMPKAELKSDGYDLQGGIAVISLSGVMTKNPTSMGTASTVALRRAMRGALRDESVSAILLVVDSPGGSVSGVNDLASDVSAIKNKKPVYVYVEDTCCSAAYWVASQATEIYSNPTGVVGSIGVYTVIYDASEYYEGKGIKTHVLSTGAFKGAGAEGSEITDEQLAQWQKEVDAFHQHFLSAVSSGRDMTSDEVGPLADGRVFMAREAKANGLVDHVLTIDEAYALIRGQIASAKPTRRALEDFDVSASAPIAMTYETALDAARIAVENVMERTEAIYGLRDSQNRKFSEPKLDSLKQLHVSLGTLIERCMELGTRAESEQHAETSEVAELEQAILATSIFQHQER